ncbi:70 kDa peptidyl-prolyl isomerase [Bienertia sinuspersici]
MASLEIYKNLKKEILNLIGDDVLDEDELFLNLISTSEDSRRLAICILMNSDVCFSKKKEFVQVGQICSVVLEFDPNNVKAMFKRAVAVIELGKHD